MFSAFLGVATVPTALSLSIPQAYIPTVVADKV
jgi:hypothetical protein